MAMEKAYELKYLGEKLKGRGLDLAEESLKIVVEELFDFLKESAELSATPLDNVAAALYPEAKALLLGMVDKIDGKEG